jgi:hypothetical protein
VLPFQPVAKMTIGLGFIRTADEEESWRRLAAGMPEGWEIKIVGSRVFEVCITGPGVYAAKTFAPDGAGDVLRYLEMNTPAKP